MSVNRFIGYFLVLSACATIAFGSTWADQVAAVQEPGLAESAALPFKAAALLHPHKSLLKHLQVALAN